MSQGDGLKGDWLIEFIKRWNREIGKIVEIKARHVNILTPEQEEEMDRQYQAIGFKLDTDIRLASDITFPTFEQAETNAKDRAERTGAKALAIYRVIQEGGYGWAGTGHVDDVGTIAQAIRLLPARYELVGIAIYTEGKWRREL